MLFHLLLLLRMLICHRDQLCDKLLPLLQLFLVVQTKTLKNFLMLLLLHIQTTTATLLLSGLELLCLFLLLTKLNNNFFIIICKTELRAP